MIRPALLIIVALASTGCSSKRAELTVEGHQTRTVFAQSFDQAYVAQSAEGEYDILLVQDAAEQRPDDQSPKWDWTLGLGEKTPTPQPLQPITTSHSFQQIVHIHVFWKGTGGSVARDGVVTNSTIDWYVIGHTTTGQPDVLRYEGAAYVMLKDKGGRAEIDVRDGRMRKKESTGALRDPIGPATLTGNIDAHRNDPLVKDLLIDLKAQTAAATRPASR